MSPQGKECLYQRKCETTKKKKKKWRVNDGSVIMRRGWLYLLFCSLLWAPSLSLLGFSPSAHFHSTQCRHASLNHIRVNYHFGCLVF